MIWRYFASIVFSKKDKIMENACFIALFILLCQLSINRKVFILVSLDMVIHLFIIKKGG